MPNYRASVKDIFYRTGLAAVLDYFLFHASRLKNRKRNANFRKANPGLIIPPDYFLYETYQLDYAGFFGDGEATAREMIDWTSPYVQPGRILDWGCGVSRVVMHIDKFAGAASSVYACDINEEMIAFNKKSYPDISYSLVPYTPPTNYDKGCFDLVYGLSIFTHLEAGMQEEWMKEIHRILQDKGIFLFTTHGRFFYPRLLESEKQQLEEDGVFSKSYPQKGHRMMSTYNSPEALKKTLLNYFEILEFHDGGIDQSKTGGQDLWIVRKAGVIG